MTYFTPYSTLIFINNKVPKFATLLKGPSPVTPEWLQNITFLSIRNLELKKDLTQPTPLEGDWKRGRMPNQNAAIFSTVATIITFYRSTE